MNPYQTRTIIVRIEKAEAAGSVTADEAAYLNTYISTVEAAAQAEADEIIAEQTARKATVEAQADALRARVTAVTEE